MRKTKIKFIAVTALFSLAIVPGAVMDIVQPEMVTEVMATLGLPSYILVLIGVWKLLGVAALARPNMRRLNEWAYAGFTFDLTGAAVAHAASDDFAGVPVPLIFLGLLAVSYFLRDRIYAESPSTS